MSKLTWALCGFAAIFVVAYIIFYVKYCAELLNGVPIWVKLVAVMAFLGLAIIGGILLYQAWKKGTDAMLDYYIPASAIILCVCLSSIFLYHFVAQIRIRNGFKLAFSYPLLAGMIVSSTTAVGGSVFVVFILSLPPDIRRKVLGSKRKETSYR